MAEVMMLAARHPADSSGVDRLAWVKLLTGALIVGLGCFILVGGLIVPLMSPLVEFNAPTDSGWLGLLRQTFFDHQGQSLVGGHLDVPCDSLGGEAFVVGGKCYGYFGLTPALLRIPLNALYPAGFGHWSRIMMIAGGVLSYLGFTLIAARALRCFRGDHRGGGWGWAAAFGVLAALGGVMTYIVANPYGYNEAVLWGTAFALVALAAIAHYVDTGKGWSLVLALFLILFSVQARPNTGMGVIGVAGAWFAAPLVRWIPWSRYFYGKAALSRSRWPALVALFILIGSAATPILINEAKFGQTLPPFDKQIFMADVPIRIAAIDGGMFHFDNVPCAAVSYFSPMAVQIARVMPWVSFGQTSYWFLRGPIPYPSCASGHESGIEPTISLIYTAPGPMLLAFAGLFTLIRRRAREDWLWPIIGGFSGVFATMLYSGITYRYEFDLYVLVILLAALGWVEVVTLPKGRRPVMLTALCVLAMGALHVNFFAAAWNNGAQPELTRMEKSVRLFLAGHDESPPP